MKHLVPYLLFEAKEVNSAQQEFLANLRAKFDELGIEWHNLAPPRAQKMGSVYFHFLPKDAWTFVSNSGWEQGLTPIQLRKFERKKSAILSSDPIERFQTVSIIPNRLFLYVQPAGMRGATGGEPTASPIWKFRDGAKGAEPVFQYFLLNELTYAMRGLKQQEIRTDPSPAVFAKYAADLDPWVRVEVAYSPNLPEEILIQLSRDPDQNVQEGIVRRRVLPTEALHNLAKSKHENVRLRLAGRGDLPDAIMHTLGNDRSARVRQEIGSNLQALRNRELRGHGWSDEEIEVARRLGL